MIQSHEELQEINGQATLYKITLKETAEEVPYKQLGSNSEGNQFAILEDGTEITFGEDSLYTIEEI